MATESGGGPTTITVHVKFSGRSIPISLSPDATVRDLKSHLQPLTNVLPRGQKLIYKGKILVDTMTMKSSEVLDGSKIMLIASHGLHQGDGPITKDASSLSSSRRIVEANRTEEKKPKISIEMSQLDRWKVTGVVALSECHLKVVPEEIWACGEVRVLDISNNSIQEIPAKIGSLRSIHKLLLNANDISDESIKWEGITSLKSLTVLSLSQNHLATLPPAIGALTSLQQLHISNNKLTSLPAEIGLLSQLQILKASNNRISSVPSSLGNCYSLIEVDFSSNLLVELPETFGNLRNLKVLHLSNNGLKLLPPSLFKMCSKLSTLDLHNTEITMDILRQIEGWEEFDERRRSKHQKQLDFRVGHSAGFDEGADKNEGR
ncbi:LRR repeats and ubiquitin-like domain-containing protein At2g30105 isoform X1 [Magnolia sinica]|uniref:LRR repeats and ubiquitin-like domain-containing protein At2g30105 isoform X1 n=1 Tax=Magnolia sinica TaxID=86752 RepID=UPI00265936B2|nr:LRR repeats and ubiquitin-like domain-containing protein At2g30105 isoform X1 [Magnolia sinica]